MSGQAPATLVGNLSAGLRTVADRPLLTGPDGPVTYHEFAERVEGAVADLADAGVRRGDRVVLCARNRPESAVLIWACARGGFVYVGLPTNLSADAWRVLIHNAAPRLVLAEDEFLPQLPAATPLGRVLSGRRLPWDPDAPQPAPDRVYALVYTSGTTGTPKGVMITHRAAMGVAHVYGRLLRLSPGDVTPIHLPFSYVSGHISQLNPIMLGGGAAVILDRFRPRTLIDVIRDHGATVLDLVPWMFSMLLRQPDFTPEWLPSLRAVIFGGAPMPPALLASMRDRFPRLELFDVYGMSETAGMISIRDATTPAAGGTPVPSLRVRTDDASELLVRGPLTTPGYWANPEATGRLLQDGWLHTGDRAVIGADGTVSVDGRVVDMINRGGVKIAPEDVEHALLTHPAVADAAAYGIPDGAAGQAVAAAVVVKPHGQVTIRQLHLWLRALLPVHARPRTIVFADDLPRNPTGKVDRVRLRAQHRADQAD